MPRGVYSRKRKNQVQKQVKKLIKNTPSRKLSMTVISQQDGIVIDKMFVGSHFKAFQIVLEDYDAKGIYIYEVRIGHV